MNIENYLSAEDLGDPNGLPPLTSPWGIFMASMQAIDFVNINRKTVKGTRLEILSVETKSEKDATTVRNLMQELDPNVRVIPQPEKQVWVVVTVF